MPAAAKDPVPAIPPKDGGEPDTAAQAEDVTLVHRTYVVLEDFKARIANGAQLLEFKAGQVLDHIIGDHLHRTGAAVKPLDPDPSEQK